MFSFIVDSRKVKGKYLPEQDRILFWDERNIGLRADYNGVLLLDTILQTPILQTDDTVKLELLLSEAILFLNSINNLEEHGIENTADVTNELTAKISEAQKNIKKGIKAQKVITKLRFNQVQLKKTINQFSSRNSGIQYV